MDALEDLIWKEGLRNAVKFKGVANDKAVLSKIMRDHAEFRSRSAEVKTKVDSIIGQINALDLGTQTKKLLAIDPHALDPEEKKGPEEKHLPELPNAQPGKVVMRLAPYPSGALHIGNARMIILNDEYVKKYNGKLVLVFDDTIGTTLAEMNSPNAKFVIPESYDLIREGLEWLGVKYHAEYFKSDRVELYQTEAANFINRGLAYVCNCDAETFRSEYKAKGIECPCRNKPLEYHQEMYEKMKSGHIPEGGAVVRLKTGMDQKDPAIRDQVMMRISDAPHPKIGTKVRLWPTLEFSWGLDDHLLGITHIIRGSDLRKEGDIEQIIWKMQGWEAPVIKLYGRLNFSDEFKLSKTFQRNQIQKGFYEGWNDPRTWSLQSLKTRGIYQEALRETIVELGLSMRDIIFDKAWVYAKNKKIIDPISERYWFVENARPLRVTGIPMTEFVAKPLLIPSDESKGNRSIPIQIKNGVSEFYIPDLDLQPEQTEKGKILHEQVKVGDILRMKDMFNIQITHLNHEVEAKFVSVEKESSVRKIQCVPKDQNVIMKVLKPEGIVTEGFGEYNLTRLKPGSIVQFERYGFVRLQKISPQEVYGYFIND
jgi:glutamyl-tRNA synthetase